MKDTDQIAWSKNFGSCALPEVTSLARDWTTETEVTKQRHIRQQLFDLLLSLNLVIYVIS